MQLEAIKKDQHFEVPELTKLNLNKDKITLYFDYEHYLKEENEISNTRIKTKPGTLQSRFNEILGDFAKERSNVSIGEDRRLMGDALWNKYGQ